MKIALYKLMYGDNQYSINHIRIFYEGIPDSESEQVRVSEWIDVDFPPLQDSVVIAAQLKACDEKEQEIREKFQAALDRLNDERKRIQALPNLA